MRAYLWEMFAGSLGLTIVTELAAAFLFFSLEHRSERLRRTEAAQEPSGSEGSPGRTEAAQEPYGSEGSPGRTEAAQESCGSEGSPGRAGPGKRAARVIALVVLVNVLTNPPAVLICWLGRLWLEPRLQLLLELGVEAVVVAVESSVYSRFGKRPGWEIGRPGMLALAANGASWLLGLWLR